MELVLALIAVVIAGAVAFFMYNGGFHLSWREKSDGTYDHNMNEFPESNHDSDPQRKDPGF